MRLMIPALVCVTAFGLTTATGSAQTAAPATSSGKTAQTTAPKTSASTSTASKKTAAKPTTVRASGKLASVDEAGKTLTLTTSKGASEQFMLSPTAHISDGKKTIDMAALAKMTSHSVTVSYMTENGHKMAQSVHVSEPSTKTTSTKTTTKSSTAKKS